VATLALAAVAPVTAAGTGASAAPPDRLGELRELRERVEAARTSGDELRRELRDLRDAGSEQAIGERRAAAIRSMVAEVAADAGSRSSLLSSGYSAGWDGGFFLQDPDGRFRLNIGAHAQFRFIYNNIENTRNDSSRAGFEQTRTRLAFSGHVFTPDLQFFVQIDPTRNERQDQNSNPQGDPAVNLPAGLYYLEDAWVRYRLAPEWYIRAGQFKLPFNREELVDPSRQLAVERSLVNESLNIGRSQGVELQWRGETDRFSLAIHDGATDDIGGTLRVGLVDPEPRINSPALRPDAEWAAAARWESLLAGSWGQFDDFTSAPGDDFGLLWGFAGHVYKTESLGAPGNNRDEARWYGATTDLSVEFGGANVFGSFIFQYVDAGNPIQFLGAVVQGGYFIGRDHEVFARVEWGEVVEVTQADLSVITAGWNWYIDGHDLKMTLDFGFAESIVDLIWTSENAGYRRDFRGDEHQWVIRSQFQYVF
jgi:hypothetical protein